ncbi:hypothetical protein BH09BAC1_BH09BAC1_10820 [soil metagenome]
MNRHFPILAVVILFWCLAISLPAVAQPNNIQNTIDSLNLVIHKRPSDPFPVYEKAMLFLASGSKDEAFRFFRQVGLMHDQNPDTSYKHIAAESYYHMADLTYNSAKSKKEAYNYALAALKLYPKEKKYRIMSARVLVTIPETKNDGEGQFETLVKEYPNDTEVLLEYATYLEKSAPDRAAKMYEKVLRNNPSDARSLYALGNYEANKGVGQTNPDKAVAYYLKAEGYLVAALQKDPTNDLYRKKLGDLYSNITWYYKRQKSKDATEKTALYQRKFDELGVKK